MEDAEKAVADPTATFTQITTSKVYERKYCKCILR